MAQPEAGPPLAAAASPGAPRMHSPPPPPSSEGIWRSASACQEVEYSICCGPCGGAAAGGAPADPRIGRVSRSRSTAQGVAVEELPGSASQWDEKDAPELPAPPKDGPICAAAFMTAGEEAPYTARAPAAAGTSVPCGSEGSDRALQL